MNSTRQHAHELLDQLAAADAAIIERLMETIARPSPSVATATLNAAIQAGLNSLNHGQGVDSDSVFDRLDAELALQESNAHS